MALPFRAVPTRRSESETSSVGPQPDARLLFRLLAGILALAAFLGSLTALYMIFSAGPNLFTFCVLSGGSGFGTWMFRLATKRDS